MTPKECLVEALSGSAKYPLDGNLLANMALAALTAEGFVVLPLTPTEEMANAGESSLICGPFPEDIGTSPSISWAHAKSCYRAMLTAARS